MSVRKNIFLAILFILISVCIIFNFVIYSGYKRLCREIRFQDSKLETYKAEFDRFAKYYNYHTEYSKDAYNYLAIGNSLTLTPEFGHGMCSTMPDNDYFNLVLKKLSEKHKKVIAYPYNFAVWERGAHRAETLGLLNTYLDKNLNLVSVQLGENVTDSTTFENDLKELIKYVKEKAPNAKVIVVGDFWNKDINELRKKAASTSNCDFVDISEIIGVKKYQSKEGITCLNKDNTKYTVTKGMSTHPSDEGMEYIANKVLEKIK